MNESYLVRGRWLVTAADEPVLSDAALLIEAGRVAAAGDWQDLRDSYPDIPLASVSRSRRAQVHAATWFRGEAKMHVFSQACQKMCAIMRNCYCRSNRCSTKRITLR
jgi:Imidazolonepropionase-like composite domain, bacteria